MILFIFTKSHQEKISSVPNKTDHTNPLVYLKHDATHSRQRFNKNNMDAYPERSTPATVSHQGL